MINKFNNWLDNNLRSIRYEDIPTFTKQAKFFELDKHDALQILFSRYAGTSSRKDQENYLSSAWNYLKNTKTYSDYTSKKMTFKEYVENEKNNEKNINLAQVELTKLSLFKNKIQNLRKNIDIKEWI